MPLRLTLRRIERPVRMGVDEADFRRVETAVELPVGHCALVLVDVWDRHHIASHQARCQRVISETIAPLVAAARSAGLAVIHAPGPDAAAHYPQCPTFGSPAPAKWLGQVAPPVPRSDQHPTIPGLPAPPPTPANVAALRRDRRIADAVAPLPTEPVVADLPQLLDALSRLTANTLLYAGFAANICLPFRDYGMRATQTAGFHVVLVRDATTALEFTQSLPAQSLLEAAIADIEMNYGSTTSSHALLSTLMI